MTFHITHTLRKVRAGLGQLQLRRTPLDLPLFLFFVTLFAGIWLSYSVQLALYKFWMLVAALLIYYLVTAVPRRYAWWVAGAATMLMIALTFFFATAGFWHRALAFAGGFFPLFYRVLSLRIFWPLLLPHANVIAGHIAMLLPYALALLIYARREGNNKLGAGTAVCLIIALVGLLVMRSVGAWLALVAGLGVWAMWPLSDWLAAHLPLRRRFLYASLVVLMIIGEIAGIWSIIRFRLPGSGAIMERAELIDGTWRLVQDYSWFGSGLASFPALYAEYVQVVPNFYLGYSNFYLDVLLELGPVGALCLLFVWVGAFWLVIKSLRRSLARPSSQRGQLFWLRWAALASLVIILVHGAVGDILFGGLGTPLLFFTPAMAVLVSRRGPEGEPIFWNKRFAWGVAVAAIVLTVLLGGFHRRVLADWYTYHGAWLMDQALLMHWPQNEWRDSSAVSMLEPARRQFEQALALDGRNRTAQQRLGMMALWAHDMDTAVSHLQQAYAQDPSHRGVIKALGYAYAWQGQLDQAAAMLAQIPEAGPEMEAYHVFWSDLNQPQLAEKAAAMSALLNNTPDR